MKDVKLSGYIPGAIGRVAELHGRYYHEHWGFDLFFESKVATELSEFLCRFNEARDGFWVARVEEKIVGSIAIDGIRSKGDVHRIIKFHILSMFSLLLVGEREG
jgi:hypothetical protein